LIEFINVMLALLFWPSLATAAKRRPVFANDQSESVSNGGQKDNNTIGDIL